MPIRRLLLLALVLTLTILVASPRAVAQDGLLHSVSSKTLAAAGITLDPAKPQTVPAIRQSEAERLAVGSSTSTIVRESVLARVHSYLLPGRLCWVVSVWPAGGIASYGPPGSHPLRGTWDIEFIDAITGEHLGGASGGDVR